MPTTKIDTLKVPGATLHLEVSGSGPVLLLIPGAPADTGVFAGLVNVLAEKYTVVTFDLRGQARSPLDGEASDQTVAEHADDAKLVLEKFTTSPALVLGCSGGALIGLDLAARYPDTVRTLLAHEPPAAEFLPNSAEWLEFYDGVHETYRSAGAGAAMGQFIASVGNFIGPDADPDAGEPPAMEMPDFSKMSPEEMDAMNRMGGNMELFFAHQLRPILRYVPDVDALTAASTKVVVGVGEGSKGQFPHNSAAALADRLGGGAVVFPGDHQGFATHTAAFAETVENTFEH